MRTKTANYQLQKNGEFILHDYNLARPWASFFPGIAGLWGIPLWVFYVNRGQCIASAGIRTKDEAIMEFLPANKAYQLTSSQGFRTFIKVKNSKGSAYYEPFSLSQTASNPDVHNKMVIRPFDLKIIEKNPSLGLEVEVSYFSLPNAPFAALVREVTIRNISKKSLELEFLDGASIVIPSGVNNWFLKEMSRTIEAWMTVEQTPAGLCVYKLTTDPRDTAQVAFVRGANFYMSFQEGKKASLSKNIVDPLCVFGPVCDFSYPHEFLKAGSFVYPADQMPKNKTPCAFSFVKTKLAAGSQKRFFSLLGHVFDVQDLEKYGLGDIDEDFIDHKRRQNQALIDGIMDRIFTASGSESFDLYARQTYLDNCLRGGLPYSYAVDGTQKSVYVFSRKHGDLERDYNRFFVSATYFSEGEGNYRDVNQNRRSDGFFNPLLGEKNIVDFFNLIQLDGYNPLIFKGDRFIVALDTFLASGLSKKIHEKESKKIAHMVSKPFAIGDILHYIEDNKVELSCSLQEFVKELLILASSTEEATFGEGYWSDHWTYNTDLLESFFGLYPDRMKGLLLEKDDFSYFDTHAYVRPRPERYVVQHGQVRQYHSVALDEEKNSLIHKRHEEKNRVRMNFGDGEVFKTTLMDKLLCLVVNKLATLDPSGLGIEMEADKPNWYDALNGLPGILGSSVSETFELKRLIEFLKKVLAGFRVDDFYESWFGSETSVFFQELLLLLKTPLDDFDFWDRTHCARETFCKNIRRGVSGERQKIAFGQIREFFDLALKKLDSGIAKSLDEKTGFYYTYFYHRVVRHDSWTDDQGKHRVTPKEFRLEKLPLFLEGFVHALRTETSRAKAIYRAVKKSPLWDRKLKMYKVNASLKDESFELGRAKAFTAGWLENESIWLHMEYKYLLELLKNGLYDEFYKDFFGALICFQKPEVYGRSILENSSFIVSSVHPDPSLHGNGFVARLSGSTAELIHMWLVMNIGTDPFFLNGEGKLCLRFRPALSSELFTRRTCSKSYVTADGVPVESWVDIDTYNFLFLGKTLITYANPKRKNTFGQSGVRPKHIALFGNDGVIAQIRGGVLEAPYAELLRSGKVVRVEILLG